MSPVARGSRGEKILWPVCAVLRWICSVLFLLGLCSAAALLLSGGSGELACAVLMILSFLLFSAPAAVILTALTVLERFALGRAGRLWLAMSLATVVLLGAEALYLFSGSFDSYLLSDIFYAAGAAFPNVLTVVSVMEWEKRRKSSAGDVSAES